MPLSIVVHDSDLGISRGHAKIPVRVTTEPGGDEEIVYLYSGGAGKGVQDLLSARMLQKDQRSTSRASISWTAPPFWTSSPISLMRMPSPGL